MAVQRALKRVPPSKHAEARPEIVDFLVDNLLVEQYLVNQKVIVEPKEVQARIGEIQSEMTKQKQDFAKMLRDLSLTEEELRMQIAADLRWEKFALSKAVDPALKDMFQKNMDMFDGSSVRARHILITPAANDPKAAEAAKAQLMQIRKEVLAAGEAACAQFPPSIDAATKEQARIKAIDTAFSKAAEKYSACPSKREGGDISWFPRAGAMVEPFAKAAFALRPYDVSDVVTTQFGLHLILAIGRKPGQAVTFDKVKDEVKEMYCAQLRESLCGQLRRQRRLASPSSKRSWRAGGVSLQVLIRLSPGGLRLPLAFCEVTNAHRHVAGLFLSIHEPGVVWAYHLVQDVANLDDDRGGAG